ncbi:MAG: translation elongation factor Ts [Nevskiales bacterium]
MAITASLVKELRERTGAGMMECKKALVETDGNIEAAVEKMRKEGQAKADKKAGRTAAEGSIVTATSEDGQTAVLAEINCETDFVGKDENFVGFAQTVAQAALEQAPSDVEALNALQVGGETIDEKRRALIAKLGENMSVRRFERVQATGGVLGSYLHGNRIGALVALEGGDAELARDIAMHVAASNPQFISAENVPADVREKEREILIAQAADSGKPQDIIEKMVEGRIRKFLAEITLVGQPFVKDPDQTVEKLLASAGAKVTAMVRFEVGEGIEKEETDFAEEVRAQAEAANN